ncbi:multicomponent Na+:H+ antiporter subunit C [Aureimonas altamirensis DSM 21988]|uniref:Multicomponent Na+:H+ antiporter subunit C n=1 Tax=Aureimonas altamirensis DSM 21988 TaxID=1121026 RepID=A0ABY1ICF0_9HYPH|nr:NADH-quinone oxidoreductase subunit K [Aureimonas altamirensis]SHI96944.1 multicomponent Na+:H+ antiporter subunit C [Aureimonas altamirensis DSM 21988]
MNLIYALAISALASCGVYLLLSRHVIRIIIGVAILSAAVNLVILYSGRIVSSLPPIMPADVSELGMDTANPLPQALILTAIVIGFALTAFASALALQLMRSNGADDTGDLNDAERLGSPFDGEEHR